MGREDREFWNDNAVKINVEKRLDAIGEIFMGMAGTKESSDNYDQLYWRYRYVNDFLIEKFKKYKER